MTSTGPWRRSCRARSTPPSSARSCKTSAIGYIGAHSPQAKGRIERLWETLQDRLVAELRLRRIQTVDAAEAYLPTYLVDHNRRFAQPPAAPAAAWRRPPRDLADRLSCRYTRRVDHDNTVRLGSRLVQIPRGPHGRSYAGAGSSSANASTAACSSTIRARLIAAPAPSAISSWSPDARNAYAPPGARPRRGAAISPLAQNERVFAAAALTALAAHLRRPATSAPVAADVFPPATRTPAAPAPSDETLTLTP